MHVARLAKVPDIVSAICTVTPNLHSGFNIGGVTEIELISELQLVVAYNGWTHHLPTADQIRSAVGKKGGATSCVSHLRRDLGIR